MSAFPLISADMIIGFRTSITTISETIGGVFIEVHSMIISEVEYTIGFRHIRQGAVASVETSDFLDPKFDNDYDATFGDRRNPNDPLNPLETTRILHMGRHEAGRLELTIFPDVHPEEDECFTINIFVIATETDGGRVNYKCNLNEDNPDDFFCGHTVCILDDDG